MINFQNLDEDIKNIIFSSIKLKNYHYKHILNLRLTSKYTFKIVEKLFEELKPTIKNYCFNFIPKGCIVCSKVNEKNSASDFQSVCPTEIGRTCHYSFLNYCNNAQCYFNVKKSQVKIALEINNVSLFCNDIIINNDVNIPIRILRTDGSITEGVKILTPKIFFSNKKKILVEWTEKSLDDDEDDINKNRQCLIDEVLELNPQLELNKNLVNPFEKYLI